MKRGEVWWVNSDPAVGGESRKRRPFVGISGRLAEQNDLIGPELQAVCQGRPINPRLEVGAQPLGRAMEDALLPHTVIERYVRRAAGRSRAAELDLQARHDLAVGHHPA